MERLIRVDKGVKMLNKLRYRDLFPEAKKKVVFSQIRFTKRSRLMDAACSLEYMIGRAVKFPFGIRGYVIAEKIDKI